VREYAKSGKLDIHRDVVGRCPTRCMSWDGNAIAIDDDNCVKCMHCINAMPKALRPGVDTGATILIGAKAPIVEGALLASVLVPFVKMDPPYDDIKELLNAMWELWSEHGKNRERIGEFIQRIGLGNFLEQIGLEPAPEMVTQPRTNPYIYYDLN
jgi:dissimilatory sulfite reductase alpha subunit